MNNKSNLCDEENVDLIDGKIFHLENYTLNILWFSE